MMNALLRGLSAIFLHSLILFSASGQGDVFEAAADGESPKRVALQRELARNETLYFRLGEPEVSDAAYDQMRRRLLELESGMQTGSGENGQTGPVFDDRSGRFPEGWHRVPMRSLRKVYTPAELAEIYREHADRLGKEGLAYRVEPKVDGMAISVVYEGGRLRRILTRGNGEAGEDLTRNFRALAILPETLASAVDQPVPDYLELRGEAFIPKAAFARLNEERHSRGAEPFRHPRNLAVGTARLEDPAEVAARGLRLVLFDFGTWEPVETRPGTHDTFLHHLQNWHLPFLKAGKTVRGWEELAEAVETLTRDKEEWPYAADGLVIKLLHTADRLRLGMGSMGPDWAVAWKFRTEQVSTRLVGITWQVGETGVLTPVAELEAVQIGGRVIRRATLHNRDFLIGGDYRVGDTVFLHLAGDVIPQLLGVDLKSRSRHLEEPRLPARCPACGEPPQIARERVAIRCLNNGCPRK